MGCTDLEACLAADISPRTLYNYQDANEEFVQRKETLKQNPTYLAKGIQFKELQEGNSSTAQKVIDRKEGKKLTLEGGENSIRIDTPWTVTPVRAQGDERTA